MATAICMPRGKSSGALFFLILPHERPPEQGGAEEEAEDGEPRQTARQRGDVAQQRAADERRPGDQGSCTCLHGWKYSIRDRQSLGVLAFPAGVMALTERIERRRIFPSRYSHPETSSVPGGGGEMV